MSLSKHRSGVMEAAHAGLYPDKSLKALEKLYREAIEDFITAHEQLYERLVQAGILEDFRYDAPTIPDGAYVAQVDAYENARALLAE